MRLTLEQFRVSTHTHKENDVPSVIGAVKSGLYSVVRLVTNKSAD